MNKTIFITGASSGFGQACAEKFAQEKDNKLILVARRKEKLESICEQLPYPQNIHIIATDITQKKSLYEQLDKRPKNFNDIDICINNAGLALGLEPAYQSKLDDWETMLNTNINGLVYCTHYILPLMVKKNNGHIVNIGSIAGNYAYPGANIYGASKAFVKMFSQNLKSDLLGTKIRVTNIEPGLAQTEFSSVRFKGNIEKANNVYKGTTPLSAQDIAETVYWTTRMPAHVNINCIEIMPTCQALGPTLVDKSN